MEQSTGSLALNRGDQTGESLNKRSLAVSPKLFRAGIFLPFSVRKPPGCEGSETKTRHSRPCSPAQHLPSCTPGLSSKTRGNKQQKSKLPISNPAHLHGKKKGKCLLIQAYGAPATYFAGDTGSFLQDKLTNPLPVPLQPY